MGKEKKLFIYIIALCLLCLSYVFYIGNIEKEDYKTELDVYQDAMLSLYIGKNGKSSIDKFSYLQSADESNHIFCMEKGYAYMIEKDFKNAQIELEKALELRQALINDIKFLCRYGETLYENGEYDKSLKILSKAKRIGIKENIKEQQPNLEVIMTRIGLWE